MKNVLVVGGSGFIGKNLSVYLSNYFNVSVLDRLIDEEYFAKFSRINCIRCDLNNEIDLIEDKYHYIINLVSIVTAERDLYLFSHLYESNVKVLLDLYHKVNRFKTLELFVQFGSAEEYGAIESPFKESTREEPNSPYALIKQLTTNLALMLHSNYAFPSMVVRPGNLFGPYQNNTKFIPYLINELLNDREVKVTPCEHYRDFIYVDDFSYLVKEVLIKSERFKGEIVNISSGQSYKLKSIIEYCISKLNSKSKVLFGYYPYRENESMDLKCSISKLESLLDQKIELDFYRKLEEYIKTFKNSNL